MPSLQRDPRNWPADSVQVNRVRDLIESSPIIAGEYLISVDIDQAAERRFRNAIANFDAMGVNTIDWTLADNTTLTCTKAELIAIFEAASLAATIRGATLHIEAKAFKESPTTTYRQLTTWAAGYGVIL